MAITGSVVPAQLLGAFPVSAGLALLLVAYTSGADSAAAGLPQQEANSQQMITANQTKPVTILCVYRDEESNIVLDTECPPTATEKPAKISLGPGLSKALASS